MKLLLSVLISCQLNAATKGDYNSGKISYSEEKTNGIYNTDFTFSDPTNADEAHLVIHIHMANVCKKNFLYLDESELYPSEPAKAPVTSAKIKFHCDSKAKFFSGNKKQQKKMIADWCKRSSDQIKYLQKMCSNFT